MSLFGTSIKDIHRWEQQGKLDKILKALNHKNKDVRIAGIVAIGNIKKLSVFEHVVEMLKDEDNEVIREAIACIGKYGTKEALDILINFYKNNSFFTRQICDSVFNCEYPERGIFIYRVATRSITDADSYYAESILLKIKDTSYVSQLKSLVDNISTDEHLDRAIMLLKDINDKAAIEIVKPYLIHSNEEVRQSAVCVMAHFGNNQFTCAIYGDNIKDFERIVLKKDPELTKLMMDRIGSSSIDFMRYKEIYIPAIINSNDKDLCKQASDIIFKKDEFTIFKYIDLFIIGENKDIIEYLRNQLFDSESNRRKLIAEKLDKLGDKKLSGIISGNDDDYFNLLMNNYPGAEEYMLKQMVTAPKYKCNFFVETFIKVASKDFSKIKTWRKVLDAIETPHSDTSESIHEDDGAGMNNSDCHSDRHNHQHTDSGVSLNFTDEQKVILSRMKIADSINNASDPDELITKCIQNKDEALLIEILQKKGFKSMDVLEDLARFYQNSKNTEFRKLVESLLFQSSEQHINLIIKLLKEINTWVFDIQLLQFLGNEALSNSNLIEAITSNCIKAKNDDYLIELLSKTEVKSTTALADLAKYCHPVKNRNLKKLIDKQLFVNDKEHFKVIGKLLNDLYSWEIDKEQLLPFGEAIVPYFAEMVPECCNMQNSSLVLNILAELDTEKSMNVLRCFLFQKDIKIRGEAYKILQSKGEDWFAKPDDKDKVLVVKKDARLVYAFKHMYHHVLQDFKSRFLENLYEFADEEILDLVLSDYQKWNWPIVFKIAAKVHSEKSTKFLEEQLFATHNGEMRTFAANALFERGNKQWKGIINGNDDDFIVLAKSKDQKIIEGLINCNIDNFKKIINAFGKSGSSSAFDALIDISKRKDFDHKEQLFEAFAILNDKRAIPILKETLFSEHPGLRKKAAASLSVIDADYWDKIFTGNDDDYERLANFPNDETIAILKQFFVDDSWNKRKLAAEAFVSIAKKDFNYVASFWNDYKKKISETHEDSTNHYDHWATMRSGDCHTDSRSHTDTGIGVLIPDDLKL